MIAPQRKTINGVVHVSFRDILYNLLVNDIQGNTVNVKEMNEKIKRKASTNLSPKHKKRILRQVKRLGR